jgi:hypothetical protein
MDRVLIEYRDNAGRLHIEYVSQPLASRLFAAGQAWEPNSKEDQS